MPEVFHSEHSLSTFINKNNPKFQLQLNKHYSEL